MSIVGTPRLIEIRPFSGYADPSLPIGAWLGGANVEGDMSGGAQIAIIVFTDTNAPQSGNLYSLEQASAESSLAAQTETVQMVADNMESVSGAGINRRWVAAMTMSVGVAAPGTFLNQEAIRALRGIFLGGQAIPQARSSLNLRIPNVDGSFLSFTAHGYIWGPRSVLAPGGPRRPASGLFPA